MDGNGPSQSQWKLGECTQYLLFDLIISFIIGIADIFPSISRHFHVLFPIRERNDDLMLFNLYIFDRPNLTVEITALIADIILDKHHLGSHSKAQSLLCWKYSVLEFILDNRFDLMQLGLQTVQFFLVDLVCKSVV